MLGQLAGRPAHAVLAVQLGGEGTTGQWAVEPLLEAPCRVLAVAIEPDVAAKRAADTRTTTPPTAAPEVAATPA